METINEDNHGEERRDRGEVEEEENIYPKETTEDEGEIMHKKLLEAKEPHPLV